MTAKIMTERVIQVDALARVEGEGALYVKVTGGAVDKVEFRIFEPPRFFEAFLVGRDAHEAPDITSRSALARPRVVCSSSRVTM